MWMRSNVAGKNLVPTWPETWSSDDHQQTRRSHFLCVVCAKEPISRHCLNESQNWVFLGVDLGAARGERWARRGECDLMSFETLWKVCNGVHKITSPNRPDPRLVPRAHIIRQINKYYSYIYFPINSNNIGVYISAAYVDKRRRTLDPSRPCGHARPSFIQSIRSGFHSSADLAQVSQIIIEWSPLLPCVFPDIFNQVSSTM